MAMRTRRDLREPDARTLRAADREQLPDLVMQRIESIVRAQHAIYDRFLKLEALYDPNSWAATGSRQSVERNLRRGSPGAQVIENVIASNVDAITGSLGAEMVRARFQTTGADWKTQRRARELEYWTDGADAALGLDDLCREKVREAAKKGTGVVKVDTNAYGEIEATAPLIDDIIVDEGSLQPDGEPMEILQRHRIDRDELAAQHPKHEKWIMKDAPASRDTFYSVAWTRWFDDGRLQRNQIGMLEGWIRPAGRKGRKGYKPGRHFKVIQGRCLLADEWNENSFVFARVVWVPRPGCWYGIGGGERIAGHQRRLNKQNWQFDRQLDQIALPTTYVDPADANISVTTHEEFGTVAVVNGQRPTTVVPTAIGAEQYTRHRDIREGSFEEFGQSRLAATAMKPSGIDSGAALREYKDQTSDRFGSQEADVEKLKLDCVLLAVRAARRLGDKAPTYYRQTFSRGSLKIRFKDVDPDEAKTQITAASKLARTSAGRKQAVIEMAQAGLISTDESRKLLQHEDLERVLSLYTAARENVERALEEMKDGIIVMPTPTMNLQMCVVLGEREMNLEEQNGAPEQVLEILRQFTVTAAWMLAKQQMGSATPGGMMAGAPAAAGALPPGPAGPLGMPGDMQPPIPAMAPDAQQLVIGGRMPPGSSVPPPAMAIP